MNNFKDAVSEYGNESEDGTRYASSDAGGNGNGKGLESIEALHYQSTDSGERPRRNKSNEINFLTDARKSMTYGRRIALCLSKKYAWYNPQLKQKKGTKTETVNQEKDDMGVTPVVEENGLSTTALKASIEDAWAYFEHSTLPRHKCIPKNEPEPVAEDMKIRKPSSLHSFTKLSKKVFKGEQKFDISVPGEDKYETEFYHPVTTPLNQMGDFGLGVGLYFSTLRAMTVLMLLAGLMNIPNFLYFGSDEYSNSQEGVAWYLKGKLLS
jgi:hypothetical protein